MTTYNHTAVAFAARLDNVARRLAADVPPGHVDYISRHTAADVVAVLAQDLRTTPLLTEAPALLAVLAALRDSPMTTQDEQRLRELFGRDCGLNAD